MEIFSIRIGYTVIYRYKRDMLCTCRNRKHATEYLLMGFWLWGPIRYNKIHVAYCLKMTRPDMKKRVCWQTLKTSPLFAVLFPNSITIVKTSNAKQLRPTTMATLLGNKILFLTLFYSSLLCTLQCEIICYPWFSSSCTFMPTMHWSGKVLLKKSK